MFCHQEGCSNLIVTITQDLTVGQVHLVDVLSVIDVVSYPEVGHHDIAPDLFWKFKVRYRFT